MKKILLGTTNEGKVIEMKKYLSDLPFEVLTLNDLGEDIDEPKEPHETIEENAFLKSRYYAQKTGYITLSDDGGLFIDAFDGWPGVKSARVAESTQKRREVVLDMLDKKGTDNKDASFRTVVSVYDPARNTSFSSMGITEGKITEKPEQNQIDGFGYDPIFYVNEAGKTYAAMTTQEKNEVSHRGKALKSIESFLYEQYTPTNIVTSIAIIVKNGKILMNLRNDPQRKEHHKKWEFPGGVVEAGETIEECVKKEAREETGYEINIIKKVNEVYIEEKQGNDYHYQIYLVPFICSLKKTEKVSKINDKEVLKSKWCPVENLLEVEDQFPGNKDFIKTFYSDLKQTIDKNNL